MPTMWETDTPDERQRQLKTNVFGKLLRIDPLDPALTMGSPDPISANGKYRIPQTNPFLNEPGSVPEIYRLRVKESLPV